MDREFGMAGHLYSTVGVGGGGRGGEEREERGGERGGKESWREGERGGMERERGRVGERGGEREGGGRERGRGWSESADQQTVFVTCPSQARYRINQTYTSLPQLSEHVHTATPHTSERALQVCNERQRTQNK